MLTRFSHPEKGYPYRPNHTLHANLEPRSVNNRQSLASKPNSADYTYETHTSFKLPPPHTLTFTFTFPERACPRTPPGTRRLH